MANTYGIDTSKPVTAKHVRDAIVECFYLAHCANTELTPEDEATTKGYCRDLVIKAFEESGEDFGNPTKESINKVISYLANFSAAFRSKELINKHKEEITQLLELIK